ncbi:MAG: pyridoxal-phosphate dependent enzyme [Bacteroidia bacterium]|nr:pyridoxal-phosphate dependent enzyme [Bacteroidia bacterium]
MWYNNILETIGNTPLLKLNNITGSIKGTVLVKVEYFNPGQSIKDRMAVKMLEDAEKNGKIRPGGTIIESTSGNTGMGLALAAVIKGYRCIFTMADKQSKEKIDILRAVGAEVIVCPTNVEPEDPRSYYSTARRLEQEIPNSIWMNQYDNMSNTAAHYETTGPEIWDQTEGKITHFAAGMGTCGTICGVSQYLKEKNPSLKTIGLDTYGSVFKKLHETGIFDEAEIYPYLTEGIGEDIVPANCNMSVIDKIIKVTDKDAALMTRKLARLEGLFVGWSCGSAVYGALEYAKENLKPNDVMVIILPDHGTRYLGKVYNDIWMKDHNFVEEGSFVTAQQIIEQKGNEKITTLSPNQTLVDAISLMREKNISQLPVVTMDNRVVGSITESRILNIMIDNPTMKGASVSSVMNDPFPFVLPSTRIDAISKLINKNNPAVLVQLNGDLEIITEFDLIQILAS